MATANARSRGADPRFRGAHQGPSLAPHEAQQIMSESIAVSQDNAVGCPLIYAEPASSYCLRQLASRELKRIDFVLVALNDQGRHLDCAQVRAVIGRRNTASTLDNGVWRGAQELIQNPLDHGR